MRGKQWVIKFIMFFTIIVTGIILFCFNSFTQETAPSGNPAVTENKAVVPMELPPLMTSNNEVLEPAPIVEEPVPAEQPAVETPSATPGLIPEQEGLTPVVPSPALEQPQATGQLPTLIQPPVEGQAPATEEPKKEEVVPSGAELKTPVSTNVTLDFKDADIRNVLRILSYKSGVNIVASPEVSGMVTIRLMDVPWQTALDVILKTYGFGYEKHGNIIAVSPLDKLTAQKKAEADLAQVQPTETRVFTLRFTDAGDMKKAIESQLSPRGKITVLEMTGPAGWEFGTTEFGKRKRLTEERRSRSKTLIISDVPPILEKIVRVINELDTMPQQVLIEARLMEVQKDTLKDFGLDYGTGQTGADGSTMVPTPTGKVAGNWTSSLAGHVLSSRVTPSGFGPKAGTALTSVEPYNVGLELLYKRLTGAQFEVILHALEEDVRSNTLSAPRILTINNQEASILVGTKYPILETQVGEGIATTTLSYYQDIGIQLNVVPQINTGGYINMIVHPAVTSYTNTVGTTTTYPIIESRETEVQIIVKDGETVVIGGLLKDIKTKSKFSVPILGDIPFLGKLFQRNTIDTGKVDLLVFITAHIVKTEPEGPLAKVEEKIIPESTPQSTSNEILAPALTPPKTEEPKK